MQLSDSLQNFFGIILKGESKTYNDHNWYTSSGLKGYIQGGFGKPYPLLKKPLSEYTLGEVKKFQSRQRDSNGQMWATGRYQMIPESFKGAQRAAGLSDNDLFNKENQDKMGLTFLKGRPKLWAYVKGSVPDTTKNLEDAVLGVAMTWSSVGVPYRVKGRHGYVEKDQSYYSGGGDRASVKSDTVADALKKLRAAYTGIASIIQKSKPFLLVISILVAATASWVIYRTLKNKPILPKLK